MLEYLWQVGSFALKYTGTFGRTQWTCIFAAALVVGFFCTRGRSQTAY